MTGAGPKLVIFDCDGTLIDSQHMIVAAMTDAFAAEGLNVPTRDRVVGVVGLSLDIAIAHLVPEGSDLDRVERLADAYKQSFAERRRRAEHIEPLYEGVRETLEMLAARDGVVLAIATGKSRRGVDVVLEREGLRDFFSSIQTADNHPSKPHPSMIMTAMVETGASAADTVMIGDTTYDIEMALAAGTSSIGVSWGYHAETALRSAGAHEITHDCAALERALDRIIFQRLTA